MIDAQFPQELIWLERFFSGRNALRWEAVSSRSASAKWLEHVVPWISMFASSKARLPIVLPIFSPEGPCQWYAMAVDEIGANALSQELTAFIGPSFSNFQGRFLEPDPGDVIECALIERFGRFVFRLDPIGAMDSSAITEALKLYLGLLRRRPDVPDRTQRPFGKIRAEFDRALLAGNEPDAIRLLEELIGSGRVDTEQEKYLGIRLLAGLGHQYQLAHDYSLLKSILGLSLPAQTIADVVGALYSTYIANIEDCGEDETVLEVFRKEIAENFGPLFLERKGVMHPSVLKAFLLYELVQTKPNRERCQAILSAYPDNDKHALVERWVARLPLEISPRGDLFESARFALADEDYNLALQLSFDAFPDSWTYSTLLRCAVEVNDFEIIQRVLEAIDQAPETECQKLNKRDLARLQLLRSRSDSCIKSDVEISSPDMPIRPEDDWLSWVAYVENGDHTRPPLQILEDVLPRWNVERYASDPVACRELAEKIGNASRDTEETFRDAFAPLVEFFVDRPERPVRAFAPLYAMLIRIIAWNGMVSVNELELALTVMQAFVNLAPSRSDYTEAVDAYSEILVANSAPSNVDWALNSAEMLALQASPDSESRLRLFMVVVELARSCVHRLSTVQYEILSTLAKDYGCSELLAAFPRREEVDRSLASLVDFSGLIGIYTLTEPAGQRARQFLIKLFPQARVEVNADHVATDKLKGLAANADIFVFAWKSSKHQAYFAAKDARAGKEILLPLGKGSASILNCVMEALVH